MATGLGAVRATGLFILRLMAMATGFPLVLLLLEGGGGIAYATDCVRLAMAIGFPLLLLLLEGGIGIAYATACVRLAMAIGFPLLLPLLEGGIGIAYATTCGLDLGSGAEPGIDDFSI